MNKKPQEITVIGRRRFVQGATGALALPLLFHGLPMKAYDGPMLQELFGGENSTDRVLVLVQLNGGNDGLNTVIPLEQYSSYQSLRSNIAIAESAVLKLRNTEGLHPTMTGLHSLWHEGKVNVVHGVTYPNPNLSHFRSTDIWMSGSGANQIVPSGWMGRYLDTEYPNYPTGYPNQEMPDPIAIQMGAVTSLALTGPAQQSLGIALQDPEAFYRLVSGSDAPGTDLPAAQKAAENIRYVREVQGKSMLYSTVIKGAADKAQNKVEYPTANRLADQLKIVSRLIAGGLKTRVYVVQLGGFDTHAAQTDGEDTSLGAHAGLLTQVSAALAAFQADIEALGVADRVVAMTFSEFGRRPASNVSLGTDHGTAAPMFVLGTSVIPGFVGSNPDLDDLDRDNLKMQFDFRQIYASVLEQWFLAAPETIKQVLLDDFETVPVITTKTTTVSDAVANDVFSLSPIRPNPVKGTGQIRFSLRSQSTVRIDLFDAIGFHVVTLLNAPCAAGDHNVPFSVEGYPSGTYVAQIVADGKKAIQTMVVVR